MDTLFAVVCFTKEDDAVGVISSKWCIGTDKCYWPPYTSQQRIDKAARLSEDPLESWPIHSIRILAIKDSYERAYMYLKRAEETSDLQTEDETQQKRRKIRRKRLYSETEDGESDDDVRPKTKKNLAKAPRAPNPPELPLNSSASLVSSPTTSSFDPAVALTDLQPPSPPVVSRVFVNTPRRVIEESPGSSQANGQRVTATERLMIRLLTEMKDSIEDLTKQVAANTKLLQHLQASGQIDDGFTVPDDVVLPADNLVHLETLESAVEENNDLQRYLINCDQVTSLAARGGNTVKDCVKRMLRDLLSNNLMKQMNWTGQGQKIAFQKLHLKRILQKAMKRNPLTKQTTEAEMQLEVSKYLKGSTDRDGGRKNRTTPARGTMHAVDTTPAADTPTDVTPAADTQWPLDSD